MQLRVSALIHQFFKVITQAKYVLTILELKWNQCQITDKKTKLGICHINMLTPSTQHQNSFISRRGKNENVCETYKNEKCTCKACKTTVFHCQISKLVTFLLPSSSWFLKFPNVFENVNVFGYQSTLARWSLYLRRLNLPLHLRLQSEKALMIQT